MSPDSTTTRTASTTAMPPPHQPSTAAGHTATTTPGSRGGGTTTAPAGHPDEPTLDDIADNAGWRELGLTDDEYDYLRTRLGRTPTFTEIAVIGVMWSEHCAYTSSRHLLRTLPTSGTHVLQGPGENAGVIDIGDGWAAAFKIESHNHPSAIEPYEGAATGVGGIIRDVTVMGARPVGLLNSLRFGNIDRSDDTTRHSRHLFDNVVRGVGDYGNCVGIPMLGGELRFADCYDRSPLVNAMCIGLMPADRTMTGHASGVGNPVFAVGARTGRDGIHGATFASVTDPHEGERSAVQVGDPFMEKLLVEATIELIESDIAAGIQDMGAAGLTSSAAEMASRAGTGIHLELDLVPRREDGMLPWELMLSESQERMLVVAHAGREQALNDLCERWGIDCVQVGTVTNDGLLRLTDGDHDVAALPIPLVVDEAPSIERPSTPPDAPKHPQVAPGDHPELSATTDEALLRLLASPGIASREWVYRQFDTQVGAATIVPPGSDAGVVRVHGTNRAIAATVDCNDRWCELDPARGAAHAVAAAARNLTCAGAEPRGATDCLNFSRPDDPRIMWQFEQSIAGLGDACRALDVPIVSGNVSFYNQVDGIDVHPTPVVGMVGVIEDVDRITTQASTRDASVLIAVGPAPRHMGGSEYLAALHGTIAGPCPPIDLDAEQAVQSLVREGIRSGDIAAAHDVGSGGLATTLATMCITGARGASITLAAPARRTTTEMLFAEGASRVVVEVAPDAAWQLAAEAAAAGVDATMLGFTGGDDLTIDIDGSTVLPGRLIDQPIEALAGAWTEGLPCLMH